MWRRRRGSPSSRLTSRRTSWWRTRLARSRYEPSKPRARKQVFFFFSMSARAKKAQTFFVFFVMKWKRVLCCRPSYYLIPPATTRTKIRRHEGSSFYLHLFFFFSHLSSPTPPKQKTVFLSAFVFFANHWQLKIFIKHSHLAGRTASIHTNM